MHVSRKISPATASDPELISHFRSTGDDAAFSEIVGRYLPLVMAVTRRRLGKCGLAEDAAQQTFIALFRVLGKRAEIPCLAAWLQKAAVYEASNLARKETRHRRRAETASDLWSGAEPGNDDCRLDQALAALPDRDRQILLLHHFEKLPFAAVADRLGISEAAAQRGGHRALAKLAKTLRPHATEGDGRSCAIWLGASLMPAGAPLPGELVARMATVKKATAHSLPWLPIAAVITLGGGVWTAVAVTRPAPPSPPPVAESRPLRERPPSRPFQPRTADDKLSDETREFISRAKADSKDAWEWVQQRPQGAIPFIEKEAVRALADRDLPAAERFLAVIEGIEPRGQVIDEIFGSVASGNFESGIAWVESVAGEKGLRGVHLIDCDYENSEDEDHDYVGALRIARLPKVREWLVRQACAKAKDVDETLIEKLAATLKDNERQIALGHAASLLLQRGDPRGYELLDQVKADLWQVPDADKIALRDPQGLLEWVVAHPEAGNRDRLVDSVWLEWSKKDAPSAVAWAKALDKTAREELGITRAVDKTAERLFNRQP